jgi:ABC-type multidrug transport system fused ATPase/permease subunit
MDLNSVERIEEYSTIEPEKYSISFPETDPMIPYRMLARSFFNFCRPFQSEDCEHYLRDSRPSEAEVEGLNSWPSLGEIIFESVTLQYKSSPQPVLR